MVSDLDIYRFDLLGYNLIRSALTAAEVAELNARLDAMPRLKPGQWYGHIHGHSYNDRDGINYQQIYEAGEPFERLIDHPSWYEHVRTFVGGEGTFDYHHGPLFIDECFANFRGPGEGIGMHSGADECIKRNQFHFRNGRFMCGQVNVLIALTDIGPGDGGTVIIPASHKQHFKHPAMAQRRMGTELSSGAGMEEALEVHVQAGDALVFVDATCHGSSRRTNPGERRIVVFRYGPSWGMFRHGYRPSPALLARLTPPRRQIVWPHQELPREPNLLSDGGRG